MLRRLPRRNALKNAKIFGLHQMLSHGKAGIDPGRWAYATLPKPLDLEASDFTTAGSWPRFWSLEVHVTPCVRRQDRRRIEDAPLFTDRDCQRATPLRRSRRWSRGRRCRRRGRAAGCEESGDRGRRQQHLAEQIPPSNAMFHPSHDGADCGTPREPRQWRSRNSSSGSQRRLIRPCS